MPCVKLREEEELMPSLATVSHWTQSEEEVVVVRLHATMQ